MLDTAVILVGGFGKRLQSVVNDVPKPLAPVNGKPFLFLILEALAKNSVTQVILLTGYMHEKIVSACGDGAQFGITLTYSHEKEPLGTGGALKLAAPLLMKEPFAKSSDFILLNGDTYCPEAITALVKLPFNSKTHTASIAASYHKNAARFGTIEFNPDTHQITSFKEKQTADSGHVNVGAYRISKSIFSYIPDKTACSLEQEIFPVLLEQKTAILDVCLLETNFDDIGLPESYQSFLDKNKEIKNI